MSPLVQTVAVTEKKQICGPNNQLQTTKVTTLLSISFTVLFNPVPCTLNFALSTHARRLKSKKQISSLLISQFMRSSHPKPPPILLEFVLFYCPEPERRIRLVGWEVYIDNK
jgi:hypothetical protein